MQFTAFVSKYFCTMIIGVAADLVRNISGYIDSQMPGSMNRPKWLNHATTTRETQPRNTPLNTAIPGLLCRLAWPCSCSPDMELSRLDTDLLL